MKSFASFFFVVLSFSAFAQRTDRRPTPRPSSMVSVKALVIGMKYGTPASQVISLHGRGPGDLLNTCVQSITSAALIEYATKIVITTDAGPYVTNWYNGLRGASICNEIMMKMDRSSIRRNGVIDMSGTLVGQNRGRAAVLKVDLYGDRADFIDQCVALASDPSMEFAQSITVSVNRGPLLTSRYNGLRGVSGICPAIFNIVDANLH